MLILTKSSSISYMEKMEPKERRVSVFLTIFGVILGILITIVYEHSGIKDWVINFRGVPY